MISGRFLIQISCLEGTRILLANLIAFSWHLDIYNNNQYVIELRYRRYQFLRSLQNISRRK